MPVLTTRSLQIPPLSHGQRADVVLATLLPEYSRSTLQKWLKEGFLTLNQRHYQPKDIVYGGEMIQLIVEHHDVLQAPQAENIPLTIVFEDEHLLVLNKPSHLIVHPGAGNPAHTLVNALLHHDATLSSLPRAGIVHRLDKDTTGLLIVGKSLTAYTQLVRMMQARDITRRYLALVEGAVISGGVIDTFYGRHPRQRLKMAVCASGKQAVTHFRVQQRYTHASLLEVTLLTGRTHQIRVHMAHVRHPVIGDQLYNPKKNTLSASARAVQHALYAFPRQALHAYSLSFTHPITAENMHLNAPLPEDFQSLLTLLDHDHENMEG